MAVKQSSQPPDGRAAFGLRALKCRARGGRWIDLVPAAPQAAGAPAGTFGPALVLRSGALARPSGTEIAVRRDRIVVHGGWASRGRWVRSGVRFRFVADRARRAHRRADAQGRPDHVLGADRRPARADGPRRRRRRRRGTRASAATRVRLRGPFASSSSLDVWRSDLEVRAAGRRVRFAIRAR